MKIELEPTNEFHSAANLGLAAGVPARLWKGVDDDGLPVHAWIIAVSPQTQDPDVTARYAAALQQRAVTRQDDPA